VAISITDNEAKKRSIARGVDSGRIEDSDISIIEHRMGIYTKNRIAIEKYLIESGIGCTELMGDEPVDEITKSILALAN